MDSKVATKTIKVMETKITSLTTRKVMGKAKPPVEEEVNTDIAPEHNYTTSNNSDKRHNQHMMQ